MMRHEEIESLLGAYSLDAVEADEAREIDEHLATCPRCRAEVAAHREVAALLGNTGTEAPLGLWERIALEINGDEGAAPKPDALIAQLPGARRPRRFALPILAAAAVIAIVALSLQVVHLNREMRSQHPTSALAASVSNALAGPHTTIKLTALSSAQTGEVVVTADGTAYWVASSLKTLRSDSTYQLWGLSHNRIVSLGLLGPDAQRYSAFRLESDIKRIMVTAEPEGGAPVPTTAALVAASVPSSI